MKKYLYILTDGESIINSKAMTKSVAEESNAKAHEICGNEWTWVLASDLPVDDLYKAVA